VLGSLVLSACAPEYVLAPTVRANAIVAGMPASDYPIPPEAPKGDVRVTAPGVVDLRANQSSPTTHALLVRMVASNAADLTWRLDTREQYVAIGGQGQTGAAYVNADVPVNADAPGSPIIEIPPGQKHTIDFYFPLPPGIQKNGDIPAVDFSWRVETSAGAIAQRTPFERFEVVPPAPAVDYTVGVGYGPYWWYDPFWPAVAYPHPYFIGPAYGPGHFVGGGPIVAPPAYAHPAPAPVHGGGVPPHR
jgi:hypothetical protein